MIAFVRISHEKYIAISFTQGGSTYQLAGTVVHSGGAKAGHYTANVWLGGWQHLDDGKVDTIYTRPQGS